MKTFGVRALKNNNLRQYLANLGYVVFGSATVGASGSLDLANLNGTNGFVINGIDKSDNSGVSVSSAGDVNNDGFDDLIIGAHNAASPGGNSGAGESYVVFGGANVGSSGSLNLSSLNGSNGFVINGIDTFDFSGISVSSAGDVNNDGFDDLIIGAYGADPGGNDNAGESYVVFGGANVGSSGSLDLSSLNGTNGFVINGIDVDDLSGHSVSGAGDVNNDGFADLIIGAESADPGGNSRAGESYVVLGGANVGASGVLNLSNLNGSNGLVINGIDAGDESGISVSSAGDVNNDGFADLIIGARAADPGGNSDAGESYVIFGSATVLVNQPPTITSNNTASVPENSFSVLTVTATDPDAGDTVTFSIAGGVDANHFNINPNTGELSFQNPPDFENPGDADGNNDYIVDVRASDNAGASDTQTITVTVTDVVDEGGGGGGAEGNAATRFDRVTVIVDAATPIDDHFTGDSGGVPAAWTDIGFDNSPSSTVVESGTVVTITDFRGQGGDGPQLIQSNTIADTTAASTIDLDFFIDGTSADNGLVAQPIVGFGSFATFVIVGLFDLPSDTFTLALFDASVGDFAGQFPLPAGPHVPSYNGGTINVSLAMDADSFSLSTDVDGFNSGDILFSSAGVAGFDSLDDLGNAAATLVGTSADEFQGGGGGGVEGNAAIDYDQAVLNVDAAAAFNDHFTGNSGGVPAGWTDIGFDTSPASTVVESGTVVTITDFRGDGGDGPQLIMSNTTADATSAGSIGLDVLIAGTTADAGLKAQSIIGFGNFGTYALVTLFDTETDTFTLALFDGSVGDFGGGFALPAGPHVPSYNGGAITLSLSMDTDSFSLTSPTDSFNSGDILFSSAGVAGFDSLDDFGNAAAMSLGVGAEEGSGGGGGGGGNNPPSAPLDGDLTENEIVEGAANGAAVGITALATDPDGDTVTYSLTDDAGGRFQIKATSGTVTVRDGSLLNFEDAASHTITVQADDGAGGTSTADFTIAVTNANPSTPKDVDASANEVAEGAATGTAVGVQVNALDPNGPAVTYSLTDDAGGRFQIKATSGTVTVRDGSLLNFEDAASHTITVQADDGAGGTSTADFTINVINVTDVFEPVIIDNGDAGFSAPKFTGFGAGYVGAPQGYQGDVHYHLASAVPRTATWTFDNLTPGTYQVAVTWTAHANRANNSPFTLAGTTSNGTVPINQRLAPSTFANSFLDDGVYWAPLNLGGNGGNFTVTGSTLTVKLGTSTTGAVIADAVRIAQTAAAAPEIEVLDSDSNVLTSGSGQIVLPAVSVGTAVVEPVTIQNLGNAPLHLGTIEISSGDTEFTVDTSATNLTLAAGQSTTFNVLLDTSVDGTYNATVSIASDDGDENPFTFTVEGTVVDSPAEDTVTIIDDSDTGFSAPTFSGFGTGYTTNPPQGYQGNVHYHLASAVPKTATWTFDNLTAGTYQVAVTWTPHSNRANNSPFSLDGTTSVGTVHINQHLAPSTFAGAFEDNGVYWAPLDLGGNGGNFTVSGATLTVKLSTSTSGVVLADAVRIEQMSTLLAGEDVTSDQWSVARSASTLDAAVSDAVALGTTEWSRVDSSAAARLAGVTVQVANLPGNVLGLASESTNRIWLDANAAGHGWDLSGEQRAESREPDTGAMRFQSISGSRLSALGSPLSIDLLTVVTHELGHVLGLPDLDPVEHPHDVMAGRLAAGVSRVSSFNPVRVQPALGLPPMSLVVDGLFADQQWPGGLPSERGWEVVDDRLDSPRPLAYAAEDEGPAQQHLYPAGRPLVEDDDLAMVLTEREEATLVDELFTDLFDE